MNRVILNMTINAS